MGKIMDKALHANLLPTLKKLQSSRNADMSKQSWYHRNFGQMTEGCKALKNKIEDLIQASHLCKFVQRDRSLYQSPQRERYPSKEWKEQNIQRGREGSRHFDDDQCPTK